MNDQTPPDSFDEEPQPKPLDGDREFPTIAQGSNASKFGIFAFLAVGVIAIIFVAMDGMEQSAPRELTTPEEIEFRTPTPSGPYIEIEQQAEVPLEQLVPPIDERELYDPLEAQRELQMQQEALRLAREKRNAWKSADAHLKSSLITVVQLKAMFPAELLLKAGKDHFLGAVNKIQISLLPINMLIAMLK